VQNLARRSRLEAGGKREKKGGGGAEKHKKFRVVVFYGKQEIQVARARVSRTGKISGFTTPNSRAFGTVQSTLGVGGCVRQLFASATCSLQFAKASDATLSQQEKNDTEDVQRGRANISGFIGTLAS
jgi:hypothetical protein